MKTINITITAAALISAGAINLNAQTWLWTGHTDVGVNYEGGAWDLHVHAEDLEQEFEPADAVLGVDILAASDSIPSGAGWSFLGTAGDPVWILPEVQNPGLLFLGLGTEELASGLFVDDQVTLTLSSVSGPGNFALFETGVFSPSVYMNSGDGVSFGDSIVLTAGAHQHLNWAFTQAGTYSIAFEASGTLVDGNAFTSSGPVTYTFAVAPVPEPGTMALLALGGLAVIPAFRRRAAKR